jgi:hypothetical protein
MCQTPTICRELTLQWSRLGEGRYVDYVLLPPPPPASLTADGETGDITMKEPTTKGGKHGLAFRNIAYHGLGYDTTGVVVKGGNNGVDINDGADEMGSNTTAASTVVENERVVMTNNDINTNSNDINNNDNKTTTSSSKKKNEYIAMVHFHPRIIPYLRRDGIDPPLWNDNSSTVVCKRKKVDKWRIPLAVGREIGYSDNYLCPDIDSMGNMTYFAVPNYNLDVVADTLQLAMTTHNDTLRHVRNEDAALLAAAEAATTKAAVTTSNNEDEAGTKSKLLLNENENRKKMVVRMQTINQTNSTLKKENAELSSRLLQNDITRNTLLTQSMKLTRIHDRLVQRVERLEKTMKQSAKKRAREEKARNNKINTNMMGGEEMVVPVGDDNGITAATTTTPTTTKKKKAKSSTASITKEGNVAPPPPLPGKPFFTNGTNCTTRRVGGGSGGKRNSDARMDRAVEAKFHNPSLSAEEALCIGGFVFSTTTTTTVLPPPGMPFFTNGGDGSGGGGVDGSGIPMMKTSNSGNNNKGGRDATIVDTDNISLAQRKNNLLRRLRLRRNAAFEAAATAASADQHLDNANVHVGLQWGGESV